MANLNRTVRPPTRAELDAWFASPRATRLLSVEGQALSELLPTLFGRNLLQVGNWGQDDALLGSSNFVQSSVIGYQAGLGSCAISAVDEIPLERSMADAIVLPHTLEFAADPHRLLRNVDRALTDRGHLMLVGFNPFSGWAVSQRFGPGYPAYSFHTRMYSDRRVAGWLAVLGFEVQRTLRFGIDRLLDDQLMSKLRAPFSEGYALLARKRMYPMTPERTKWKPAVGIAAVAGPHHARMGSRRG